MLAIRRVAVEVGLLAFLFVLLVLLFLVLLFLVTRVRVYEMDVRCLLGWMIMM